MSGGAAPQDPAAAPGKDVAAAWHPGDMATRIMSPVLVGRAGELAVLTAALAPARRDGPSVVLIGGEAGVGKSRLVREFAARSRAAGARVLTGGCVELGTDGLPFAPFTAVLRELVRDLGADGVARLLPGGATRDFARLLPEFGAADGDAGDIVARARLFEQVLALLERLADDGPVVLLIEDAHWADRSTRDLLAFLVGRQQILDGVLIIVTYRSDELHRTHPLRPLLAELGRLGWVERMDLPRLDRRHADELVARLLGREPELSLADQVYLRAEGNPLFVEELLCDCTGGVVAVLPASLRDLLLISVQRLPDETQEVLRAAGAGGQRNGHALLMAVTGLADDALSRALRPAVEANVLTADADGYAFRHGLIREAVLDDLLPGDHTRLHTRFAEALGADPGLVPPGRAVIEQAHHWYAAHDTVGALVSSWRAAAEAGRAAAPAEQLTLLARVLELWDKVPDAEQRIGASHLGVLEHASAVAKTAEENERGAAFASAALDEVDPAAEPVRAARLLETRALLRHQSGKGDVHADLQAALDLVPPGVADAVRAQVLLGMARHAWPKYGPQSAAAIDEALGLARQAGDAAMEASVLADLAIVQSRAGDDATALETIRLARAVAGRAAAYEPMLCAVTHESHLLEGTGEHEQAAEVARAGIASAEDYGLARSAGAFLAINMAEPLVSLGRWDEAIEVIEHALALSPSPTIRAALRPLAGEVALRRGDLAGAAESAVAARAALGAAGCGSDGQYHIPLLRLELELRLAEGRLADALAVADAAGGLDLAGDPRYAWPLLAAAARAVTAAAQARRGGGAPPARAADLLARLDALAAQLPASGPVQRAEPADVPRRGPPRGAGGPRQRGEPGRVRRRRRGVGTRRPALPAGRGAAARRGGGPGRGRPRRRGGPAAPRGATRGPPRRPPAGRGDRGAGPQRQDRAGRRAGRPGPGRGHHARPDRPGVRGAAPGRRGPVQPGDRRPAVHLGQDRQRPRVEHPGQGRRGQPRRGGGRGVPAAPVRHGRGALARARPGPGWPGVPVPFAFRNVVNLCVFGPTVGMGA